MKSFSVSGVACFLTLCLGVSAQGAYTFTPIDMPGADATWAWGIDGSNIVGEYTSGGANISHGFSYDGSTYTIRDVPGALASYAHGIDGGNIVGQYAGETANRVRRAVRSMSRGKGVRRDSFCCQDQPGRNCLPFAMMPSSHLRANQ